MKEIALTQGKVALVDDEDFERVSQFKWFAHTDGTNWYALRKKTIGGKEITIRMHQYVMGQTDEVDHRNGFGLDNQKRNLRFATTSQNQANKRKQRIPSSSKYKGVCFRKDTNKWRAYIGVNQHLLHLGSYDSEQDAAVSYNHAAMIYFGDFARLNPV